MVCEGSMQAKADTRRLEDAGPEDARQLARRWNQNPDYCTSLRTSTSHTLNHGQHLTDNGCGHWRIERAAARSDGNEDCTIDKHSRRPGFCGTNFTNSFLRQPLSPQQTPKLKHPRPKGLFHLLTGCFETRLQNPFEDDLEDQCLSRCQNHERSLLELLTGNWTCHRQLWYSRVESDETQSSELVPDWDGAQNFSSGLGIIRLNWYRSWVQVAELMAGCHLRQAGVLFFVNEKRTKMQTLEPGSMQPWGGRSFSLAWQLQYLLLLVLRLIVRRSSRVGRFSNFVPPFLAVNHPSAKLQRITRAPVLYLAVAHPSARLQRITRAPVFCLAVAHPSATLQRITRTPVFYLAIAHPSARLQWITRALSPTASVLSGCV